MTVAARLAAINAARARSELALHASDELRTPLTVLQGYISMLQDGSLPPEEAPRVLVVLAGKAREMNERIDALVARVRGNR